MTHRYTALLLAGLLTLSAGGAVVATAQTGGTFPQAQDTATVTFDDQTATDTVTVQNATLPDGGFVAIHESDDGEPGDIVGVSAYLTSGTSEDVEVTLDTPVTEDTELVAMPHRDTDGDETFDFETNASVDGPYLVGGSAVTDAAQITADGDDADNETDANETEATGLTVATLEAPANATVGQTLTVVAGLENPSDSLTTEQVQFRFDGTLLANKRVSVEGGGTTAVTFEIPTGLYNVSAGEYTHGVFTSTDGETATIGLNESFELTGLDAPTNATVGDEVTVDATVENPNDDNETQSVEFRFDGALVDSEAVELGPGESTNVSLSVNSTGVAAGNYTHGVFTLTDGAFAEIELDAAAEEPAATATVTFSNQTSDGTSVEVDAVNTSDGGFVAIHDATLLDGNVVGSVVGVSEYLEPGESENVTVELFAVPGGDFENTTLTESQTLIAMPHLDTDGDETYDFVTTNGSADGPYTEDGDAVVDDAFVTVEAATETPTETETPAPETETPTETATPIAPATPTGTETETDTATGTDTETGTETETDTATGTDTETETATGTGTETATQTETDTATGTDTETATETEAPTDVPTIADDG